MRWALGLENERWYLSASLSWAIASGVRLGRAVILLCDWGELLLLEKLSSEGRLERGFVGVSGSGCLVVCGRLLCGRLFALLPSLSSFARECCALSGSSIGSGGGDDKKSRLSHDVEITRSSIFCPLEAVLVRNFDVEVVEPRPALVRLPPLFPLSRLAAVPER